MAGSSSSSAVAASPRFVLRPCSSKTTIRPQLQRVEEVEEEVSSASAPNHGRKNEEVGGFESLERRGKGLVAAGAAGRGKGANLKNFKRDKGAYASSSSSSSSSSCVSSSSSSSRRLHRGVHLRRRTIRGPVFPGGGGSGGGDGVDVRELALPLGMSFAAIIAQVVERNSIEGERIPADHLSMICISAVKEAVVNVSGKRYECFLRSFEKAFGSTLKTLRIISEGDAVEDRSLMGPPLVNSCFETLSSQGDPITQSSQEGPEIQSSQQRVETRSSQVCQTSQDQVREIQQNQSVNQESNQPQDHVREIQQNQSLNQESNQLVLHGQITQQLAHISQSGGNLGFNRSILSTFERSVTEQARSNDLKELEIGLTFKRLQLKQSQLDLNFYANILEKVKISMGFSKARFKEEKLKNQMQDVRHAELLRRCIDFLVAGLLIMSICLGYAAWVYSYRRITEATASCTPSSMGTKAWWVPKQLASFNSGWSTLRCHVVVLTRMSFGLVMIVAIAYSLFQRSAGPMMPVTFILLVLGIICGAAGKFCIDTLGGSGYWWLLHWEALCLLHFFVNAFPSIIYPHLYGPIGLQGHKGVVLPYWFRRSMFYSILFLILPMFSGLVPFASVGDWRRHFIDMALHTKEV